jgi:hypothetical protein
MFVEIKIEMETDATEVVESVLTLLDNTLPYMADNVAVSSKVEEN